MSIMPEIASETYISVDVETAGPAPSLYSLLSIGACTVLNEKNTFYVELQPVHENALPEALRISRLSLERLKEQGLHPKEAMSKFETWLGEVNPGVTRPVFVAFNAPFDWMFVNDYFHKYLGRNPFGHSALDIKALYLGLHGVSWDDTHMLNVASRYLGDRVLTHHALQDAVDQAEIFRQMLIDIKNR